MRLILATASILACVACFARDVSKINPTFPRIGNCYGAGLNWRPWEQGSEYWSKVDLFCGGCYDLHYDWENARWEKALATVTSNVEKLRQVNPNALVLPYVDVIEGVDNPNVPQKWWDLNARGERWSGWPGMYRINTKLPEVLQYNLDMVRQNVFAQDVFDGVFYDCWSPDDWLCPRTAQLRDGKAIVMANQGSLPTKGFESLNGVLAEDESNRVLEGKVDFEDFLGRYLKWCKLSRKPMTTMIVCRPESLPDDPWRTAKMTREERQAEGEKARREDEQTMRFGLATTLMGDGYFGYDCGTSGRGNWWWYKEYDAPLGYPKGDCRRNGDGTWQREYDGGTVVVNGSAYDTVVQLPRRCKDVSTGRVGTKFTLPMNDGRIFLPTDEPETATADAAPRLTATPPTSLRAAQLPNGLTVVQTPGGLELRVDGKGALQQIMLKGKRVLTGGTPVVATPPFASFLPLDVTGGLEPQAAGESAKLVYHGTLVREAQKIGYVETITVQPDNRFTLRFDFEALTDLDIRMWRHYFSFPVGLYAGGSATAEGRTVTLPEQLQADNAVLPEAKRVTVTGKDCVVTVESTHPMALIDHRKYGSEEYLLPCYPVGGAVKAGTKLTVEMSASIAGPGK